MSRLPRFVGMPDLGNPSPFAGYDRLHGSTACERVLSVEDRHGLAPALGRFLRQLHAADPVDAVSADCRPIGRFGSTTPNCRLRDAGLRPAVR